MIGVNYRIAPLEIRERFSVQESSQKTVLEKMKSDLSLKEVALLSTCNRTEIFCYTNDPNKVINWFADYQAMTDVIKEYLYLYVDEEAVRHVFKTACGLESMVLGEPQILGQIKKAALIARQSGTVGLFLNKLFQASFSAAKDVRSNTEIGQNIVSFAAAALKICSRIFGNISEQKLLLVGSGEMIELSLSYFLNHEPQKVVLANRTHQNAEALSKKYQVASIPLEAISDCLSEFDVLITSTASPLPIIGLGMMERALKKRRHRPMVIIDMAAPRDTEPEIARLDDVFLFTIDDLGKIVAEGKSSRQAAISDAQHILEEHVVSFKQWQQYRSAVPIIRAYRDSMDQIRLTELEKAKQDLAKGKPIEEVLEYFSQRYFKKTLHEPTKAISSAKDQKELDVLKRIFGIKILPSNNQECNE